MTGQESDEQLRLLAGGKARNLCDLTAAGFPVPRWVILGIDAFETACAAAGVTISQAPLSLAERLTEAAFAETALCELSMPAEIRDAIAAAIDYVGAETVAVRSSGRQEDGDRDSFAGLFDTFLNVAGLDATEDAVRRCWASAFSRRATQYRHVRGLDFRDVALAVVIQRSLTPQSSGVMFTVDPLTGSTDRLVINGVLGLGEGLVSGAVDSDSVSIEKETGRILDEVVSAKSEMMVGTTGGGVATVGVPVERRREASVGPALRATLLDLGIRLEQYFGCPQDVEWACDDIGTWILQSRPVTTLDREFGLTAEHFGEVTDGVRIWDNSNIIESFAGVTSPLTFTTARKLYGDVYRAYARSLKAPPAQLEQMESWLPVMLGQFHGHVYYNLLHWYRMVGIAPGYPLNRRVLEVALGVSEPLDRATATQLRPFTFANPIARAVSRGRTTIAYLRSIRSVDAMIDDFDETFIDFIDRHGLMDVSAMDGPSAYRMFRQIYDEVADLWGPMMVLDAMLLTMVGSLAVLTKVFLRGAPEWVQFAVVNPEPDVISVEPARELAGIAAFVAEHPELDAFIASAEPSTAYAHLTECADDSGSPIWQELHSKIEKYIDRFGYRCLDELKLETPDLREDPAGIFHLLRMDTAGREHAGNSVEDYLDTHLRGWRRKVFDALRRKVRRAATHREHLRFCRTQGFGILKSLVGVMARELEHRGTIHHRSDVFLLRIDELFDLHEGTMTAAAAQSVIRHRKLLQESYSRLSAPARFTTTGSDYSERELAQAGWRPAEESAHASAGTVLTGTPSSPGVVTGRAVVVEKPQDFSSGILVAYRTDPGWASALPFASALLIERASPLTHVAIIARELGVPTVVQIDGLTDAVRTGMTVSVDGATGRVVLVEEPGP
ncbi:hypothetical protein BST42_08390 [Mycolicibacterium rhodesiae]|uniref:Phosphoenolpyruvate synthase n=1 Tax=Mycolicibacterium rhodesiae TaxID=36814 RepID=A0A1X0J0B4_MYCRH|nr:phosphoenolpyruvate synthase [Mycolicibacterium rhodesiae]ORB55077.1 hypothetical protein BST42_08390 [Mycolicibacterium rhodesiae]